MSLHLKGNYHVRINHAHTLGEESDQTLNDHTWI